MTSRRNLAVVAVAVAAALAGGCAGKRMQRLDPRADDNLGGTMIDSADIIATTDRAAAEISKQLLVSPRNDLVVYFPSMKNESVQPINTALLSNRVRDIVLRDTAPRVRFVAREHMDEVMKEREGKRSGAVSGEERKALLGATHHLTGRILSSSKRSEGDRADYFQMNFVLVDAESSELLWSQSYEFKKAGEAGVIYQ
jgi:penicillin-binding protein activator